MSFVNKSTLPISISSTQSTTAHIHEHDVHINFAFIIQQIVLGLIALFGIVGNIVVCYTVIKQNQIKHTTWYYLCSLSISDFLLTFINVPLFMYALFDEDIIDNGTFLCKFNGFCLICFFLTSVLILAVISFHKFLYIRQPLNWRSSNESLKFILIVWILSIGIAVAPFLGWSQYSHIHGHKQCIPAAHQTSLDRSYLSVLIFLGFVLPLTSMIFCYSFVFKSVRSHQTRLKRNSISTDALKSMRDWVILKTIFIIVIAFCVFWTPFAVYMAFSLTDIYIPVELSQAAFTLAYAQSAVNPIIYGLRHKLFRDHFKSLVCCSVYKNIEIFREQSGSAFTVENQKNSKLVHYKKKYSSKQTDLKNDRFPGKYTVTTGVVNGPGNVQNPFYKEKAIIYNTPPCYDNHMFRLSTE